MAMYGVDPIEAGGAAPGLGTSVGGGEQIARKPFRRMPMGPSPSMGMQPTAGAPDAAPGAPPTDPRVAGAPPIRPTPGRGMGLGMGMAPRVQQRMATAANTGQLDRFLDNHDRIGARFGELMRAGDAGGQGMRAHAMANANMQNQPPMQLAGELQEMPRPAPRPPIGKIMDRNPGMPAGPDPSMGMDAPRPELREQKPFTNRNPNRGGGGNKRQIPRNNARAGRRGR